MKVHALANILTAFALSVALLVTGGCASTPEQAKVKEPPKPKDPTEGWLKGSLTCLADGAVMPFRIEKKFAWGGSASGGVAATHPVSGERLTGQYTGLLQSRRGSARFRTPSGQSFYGNVQQTSRNANAIATLTGDKGTVIQLEMEILAGWTLHGIGRGTDNKRQQYQVQF